MPAASSGEYDWMFWRNAADVKARLPEGWQEFRDSASGQNYYHCAQTGETTWARPHARG